MNIEIGDLIKTKDNNQYIIVEKIDYMAKTYLLGNKVIDEEATETFYAFDYDDKDIRIIKDNELLEKLIPLFESLLKRDLKVLICKGEE